MLCLARSPPQLSVLLGPDLAIREAGSRLTIVVGGYGTFFTVTFKCQLVIVVVILKKYKS
jgi:hypothetical protein